MSELTAYPLTWPPGWQRAQPGQRKRAAFGSKRHSPIGATAGPQLRQLSVADGTERVLYELERLGVSQNDVVISTNLRLRLDGYPRSDQGEPADPGVAVYWQRGDRQRKCMAVDRYDRVADNLGAIAATLEAMRSIERHGGAAILDRAFTGFAALPAPEQWWQILGVEYGATSEQIEQAHARLAMKHHPDRGGDSDLMARINAARDVGLQASS